MLRLGAAVVLAVVALDARPQSPPPAQPPQQAQVFRAGLTTVAVPASVYDADGDIVRHLTRDNFMVFDNGRRQEITNFSSGLQPIRAVVLVDASASMMSAIDLAQYAAEQFVIRLEPEDAAKVGVFSARINISPEFTADRDALLKTLRADLPFSNPTRLLDAVDAAITQLQDQAGRRIVVVLTDGCDTASLTDWDTLLQRIHAEEVMVYVVRFRTRIQMPEPAMRSRSRAAEGPCTQHARLELTTATPISEFRKVNDPRWILGPQLLTRLTTDTGGTSVLLSSADDVNTTFTRIMQELHYQYLLGFSPATLDGKVHEIAVRVNDRALTVRARKAYVAGPPVAAR